ncbi:hypothetical protein QBC39DRAFT_435430 [Podospora conica]|nr:hypothetical protein QBC39DRAFT_435430 [Schizothecium conicum]
MQTDPDMPGPSRQEGAGGDAERVQPNRIANLMATLESSPDWSLPTENFWACLWRWTRVQIYRVLGSSRPPSLDSEMVTMRKIEVLHRFDVLWTRARVIRHFQEPRGGVVDDEVADKIHQDLLAHSNALRECRFFQTEGRHLFPTKDVDMNPLAEQISQLADIHFRAKLHAILSVEARTLRESAAGVACDIVEGKIFAVMKEMSSLIRDQCCYKNATGFAHRVRASFSGALALLLPTAILTHLFEDPSPATSTGIVVTCVTVVGLLLSYYMSDTHPKDILNITAAYAAILVATLGAGPRSDEKLKMVPMG